jgi:hypothetical protein
MAETMAPTETQQNLHRDEDLATYRNEDGRVAASDEGVDRQQVAYRSGFFRGAVIGVIVSIPLWIVIAVLVIWLLR